MREERGADRIGGEDQEAARLQQLRGRAAASRAGRGRAPTPRPSARARISAGRAGCRHSACRAGPRARRTFARRRRSSGSACRRAPTAPGSRAPRRSPSSTRRHASPPRRPPRRSARRGRYSRRGSAGTGRFAAVREPLAHEGPVRLLLGKGADMAERGEAAGEADSPVPAGPGFLRGPAAASSGPRLPRRRRR